MRGRAAALVAVALGASGCAGEESACRKDGERYPRDYVTVSEARERDGELQAVRGALIARAGVPDRLCTELTDDSPPRCRGASLELEGIRDMSAFEDLERAGETSWTASARVVGRVDGDTLRYELSCRTEGVRDHFEQETGETLTLNPFLSTSTVERLDFASARALIPRNLRDEYGVFGITVRTTRSREPLFSAELRRARRADGVYWIRDEDGWVAVKRYGGDVALVWLAGRSRRLDERWEKLDAVLREHE